MGSVECPHTACSAWTSVHCPCHGVLWWHCNRKEGHVVDVETPHDLLQGAEAPCAILLLQVGSTQSRRGPSPSQHATSSPQAANQDQGQNWGYKRTYRDTAATFLPHCGDTGRWTWWRSHGTTTLFCVFSAPFRFECCVMRAWPCVGRVAMHDMNNQYCVPCINSCLVTPCVSCFLSPRPAQTGSEAPLP